MFVKVLHYAKTFLLKIPFMFLAKFIFVVSHSKLQPAVHLSTLEALTSLESKNKCLSAFVIFNSIRYKNKMVICVERGCMNWADKNSNTMSLVTVLIIVRRNRRQKSSFCNGEWNVVLPNQFWCLRIKLH